MIPEIFKPRKAGSKEIPKIPIASGKIPHQVASGTKKQTDFFHPLIK